MTYFNSHLTQSVQQKSFFFLFPFPSDSYSLEYLRMLWHEINHQPFGVSTHGRFGHTLIILDPWLIQQQQQKKKIWRLGNWKRKHGRRNGIDSSLGNVCLECSMTKLMRRGVLSNVAVNWQRNSEARSARVNGQRAQTAPESAQRHG